MVAEIDPSRLGDAAFSLLQAHREGGTKLTRRAGNFLGECVVDPSPLSEKQAEWIATLLTRAGLPGLELMEARNV
jgi:hypothetical protein